MTVVVKPRPKKRARAMLQTEEPRHVSSLTAFCAKPCGRYTAMVNPKRRTSNGVQATDGTCSECGGSTYRVGAARENGESDQ